MYKLEQVTTKDQLDKLYNSLALTAEGLIPDEESLEFLANWLEEACLGESSLSRICTGSSNRFSPPMMINVSVQENVRIMLDHFGYRPLRSI